MNGFVSLISLSVLSMLLFLLYIISMSSTQYNVQLFVVFLKLDINIVTDLAILQIRTPLHNGRVRIPAFPTQRFSEYMGQRNINSLLPNG
jgi:hypothetical protein